MSCTTDVAFAGRRLRRGSIMMEFVLVLPIYMILLGMLFLWGDMGLKAIALAAGDRCLAFDGTDRVGFSYGRFSSMDQVKDGLSEPSRKDFRADTDVKGAWSAQYAGRTGLDYRIQSWMNGIIGYPLSQYGSASPGLLKNLVDGGAEKLDSKGLERTRTFNSYTLRRTVRARSPYVCRNWKADALLGMDGGKRGWEWSRDEKYADPKASSLEAAGSAGDDSLRRPDSLGKYRRFGSYDGWTE